VIAEPRTWVDVESAVREWVRDNVTAVNRRAFFGTNDKAGKPQIVLFRVAGPDDACLIQFDVRGSSKAETATAAAELATAADALARYAHEGVVLHGAVVDSVRWLPDEDLPVGDSARYIVDITFTATATS
jgi:hypothetical protein